MADLVRVRHKKGPRGSFMISRRLYEKHPDDYVVVKLPKEKIDTSPPVEVEAEQAE